MEKIVTFSELSEMLGISTSRLYDLIRDGIFPAPLRNPKNQRPYFTSELTDACKQVVRTRVGLNGLPYCPNKKRKNRRATNCRARHESLIVSLAGLGLNATATQVDDVVSSLPDGLEQGELVKQVFLRLRQNR